MNFKIEFDTRKFRAGLWGLMKNRIPKAEMNAINATLAGAREAVQKEMDNVFKPAPMPIIRNSVRYDTANPETLTGSVFISTKDISKKGALSAAQILAPHIFGGSRFVKRSEATLRGLGVMANDQFIVPGPQAKRDSYGNVTGSEMIRILSAAGLMESQGGYKANQTLKSQKRRGGLKMQRAYVVPFVGIFWYIPGQKVTYPVLFFTQRPPQYEKRFDFFGVFADHVQNNFMNNFLQAWGMVNLKGAANGR